MMLTTWSDKTLGGDGEELNGLMDLSEAGVSLEALNKEGETVSIVVSDETCEMPWRLSIKLPLSVMEKLVAWHLVKAATVDKGAGLREAFANFRGKPRVSFDGDQPIECESISVTVGPKNPRHYRDQLETKASDFNVADLPPIGVYNLPPEMRKEPDLPGYTIVKGWTGGVSKLPGPAARIPIYSDNFGHVGTARNFWLATTGQSDRVDLVADIFWEPGVGCVEPVFKHVWVGDRDRLCSLTVEMPFTITAEQPVSHGIDEAVAKAILGTPAAEMPAAYWETTEIEQPADQREAILARVKADGFFQVERDDVRDLWPTGNIVEWAADNGLSCRMGPYGDARLEVGE